MSRPDIFIDDDLFMLEYSQLFDRLLAETEWEQKFIYNNPIPRLTAWYGPKDYVYSGIVNEAKEMPDLLRNMKNRISAEYGYKFNSVLLNLYRDGNDNISWHSDDESELGEDPIIASLSLGAPRNLYFRHKHNREEFFVPDSPGRIIFMYGNTQKDWEHCIHKMGVSGPRINCTFRNIV